MIYLIRRACIPICTIHSLHNHSKVHAHDRHHTRRDYGVTLIKARRRVTHTGATRAPQKGGFPAFSAPAGGCGAQPATYRPLRNSRTPTAGGMGMCHTELCMVRGCYYSYWTLCMLRSSCLRHSQYSRPGRGTHRHTDRQTAVRADRRTGGQTGRQTGRQIATDPDTQAGGQAGRQTDSQQYGQAGRQTGGQQYGQTASSTGRRTD